MIIALNSRGKLSDPISVGNMLVPWPLVYLSVLPEVKEAVFLVVSAAFGVCSHRERKFSLGAFSGAEEFTWFILQVMFKTIFKELVSYSLYRILGLKSRAY